MGGGPISGKKALRNTWMAPYFNGLAIPPGGRVPMHMIVWCDVQEGKEGQKEHGSQTLQSGQGLALRMCERVWGPAEVEDDRYVIKVPHQLIEATGITMTMTVGLLEVVDSQFLLT